MLNMTSATSESRKFSFLVEKLYNKTVMGAQWLSGRVLDSRPRGRGFEPHRRVTALWSLSKTHLS